MINAESDGLRLAIDNLLDNTARHGHTDGTATVSITQPDLGGGNHRPPSTPR